jgi:hypothetical protein
VTAGLLALSLWIRFFGIDSITTTRLISTYLSMLILLLLMIHIAGVHARFDQNTKRALRGLDAFILTSCAVFGTLIAWEFINIFAPPAYALISTLTVIYTAMAALFVVVV